LKPHQCAKAPEGRSVKKETEQEARPNIYKLPRPESMSPTGHNPSALVGEALIPSFLQRQGAGDGEAVASRPGLSGFGFWVIRYGVRSSPTKRISGM